MFDNVALVFDIEKKSRMYYGQSRWLVTLESTVASLCTLIVGFSFNSKSFSVILPSFVNKNEIVELTS